MDEPDEVSVPKSEFTSLDTSQTAGGGRRVKRSTKPES
jgi:hypothetical protein